MSANTTACSVQLLSTADIFYDCASIVGVKLNYRIFPQHTHIYIYIYISLKASGVTHRAYLNLGFLMLLETT